MSKRSISSMALLLIGVLTGMAIGPLNIMASFAQGDCRTFPETGKQVCGRFLQYWTTNGGLAQQGLPLTNEFPEVSDLNGQSYTVQYFERAVFEKHPENAAPYDVLLSQLGTFRLQAKYPGGDPSGAAPPAGPTSTSQPPAAGVSDQSLLDAFQSAGLPMDDIVIYTAATDPNHLLGRPDQYTAKASWHDTRLPSPANPAAPEVSDGGGIEIFADHAAAQARADYIQNIGKNIPFLAEYDYVHGQVVLRLSKSLTPDQAAAYDQVFEAIPVP